MKVILPFTVIAVTLLLSCHHKSVESYQSEIESVEQRWLPDKRVGICNLFVVNEKGGELILRGESTVGEAKEEVLWLLKSKGVTVIDSSVILPDSVKLKKSWGIISLSISNLRSKPTHSAELVSQAIMGTPVRVLKEDGEWLLIQTPDRYIGWTNKPSVQQMSFTEIDNWKNADRKIYTNTYGTVFGNRNLTNVMSDLVAGSIVIKKSEARDVAEIILPDGRLGYVENHNWLDFKQWKDTVSLIGDNMIATGERFLGFPYLWGGTSSKGMDCSGFVKTVCFLNGVILERDASQQFRHGKEIDITAGWDNLRKGDLLFFGSRQPLRVVHVGMYIGDSEIINSSGSVRINSLDEKMTNYSKYLNSTLLGARRIIGFPPEQGYLPVRLHNWYN